MAPKCTICGADDAASHVCAGELEQTYQRDLRNLVARTRETLVPPPASDAVSLDAPASVREAIRLADTLIPVAPPEPALPDAEEPHVPPPPRGRRLALAAVVLVGALTGSLLWQAALRAPVLPQAAAAGDVLRAVETPAPERVPPVVAPTLQARAAPPPSAVAPAPRPLGLVSRPRPVKPAASASAAPPAPASPPSLMDAIVESVATRHQHPDRPQGP